MVTLSVDHVLVDLKLDEIANTTLGEASGGTRGVSGGERKRVAIGMELVVNPPVLLLDEPTTGLDAASAIQVTSLLHSLVRKRRTIVVCTVHQPRSDVFQQFGTVMVLRPLHGLSGEGVSSVFYVGSPASAVDFLNSAGHDIPNGTNIADLLLDVVTLESEEQGGGGGNQGGDSGGDSGGAPDVPSTPLRQGDMQITPLDADVGAQGGPVQVRRSSNSSSALRRARKKGWCSCSWEMWMLLRLELVRYSRAPSTLVVHCSVGLFIYLFILPPLHLSSLKKIYMLSV
jgi:hypothetical protein